MRLRLEPLNDSDQILIRSECGRAFGMVAVDAFVETLGHTHYIGGGEIHARLASGESVTVDAGVAKDVPC
jgi:hypothetical protein